MGNAVEGLAGSVLWHLAERADWEAAQASGRYDRSTRGASLAKVGFVHCSYPDQLAGVVAAGYADTAGDYVILELDREELESAGVSVRDEPADPQDPGSPLFPHAYGPLPVGLVRAVREVRVEHGVLLDPGDGAGSAGHGPSR